MRKETVERRDFLKLFAAGALTITGFRMVKEASASGPVGPSTHSWGMVIDQAACTGCGFCVLACQAHNDINPNIHWNRVIKADEVNGDTVYLSRPCMHCEHPTCVEVCPVKASYVRGDGIVMMDYDRCIGCRYCEVACPYNARAFNWEKFDGENPAVPEWGWPEVPRRPRGVVEKCSFCYQRIDRGIANGLTPGINEEATPACVVACPVGARIFGDMKDPESPVSKVLANRSSYRLSEGLGTEPRVYYLPSTNGVKEVCS